GDAFRVGRKHRQVAVPSRGKLSPLHQFNLCGEVWMLRAVRFEQLIPFVAGLGATRANTGCEGLVHAVGNKKLRILGAAVGLFAQSDLVVAEGFSVRSGSVLLVW